MTKIKICGLTRREDIEAVNQARPDYIGFVFAKSKRQVTMEQAAILKECLDHKIQAVGVFVNADREVIKTLAEKNIINMIQLHGDEDEEYIARLRESVTLPVIKAMRINQKSDVKATSADFALFDTYDKNQYGGSGLSFNWELLDDYEGDFFLAGGLHSGNIEEAINTVKPFCVDISSGVEIDGVKDQQKIIEIVDKIRRMKL
ncbi:phosphoribosylanthranilate isomerase [Acetobacterium bakii]|uniref:N-(5'-phosphoribosyl)anthranilate isomerase n=1 Tax=Acetobacterium bakii TaxID=52689 RepID=A0A0L6U046_9FIRM|nr:phosphoribosylanthranilate isomerase [Acetobacterium bakii]KNZ41210.1 N-(5'-phosphoribosyl)anthranilate isomerase [Acetobacterium bakii]